VTRVVFFTFAPAASITWFRSSTRILIISLIN